MLTDILNGYRRRRFTFLFFCLLATIGVHPALEALAPWASPLEVLLAVSLGVAIASAAHDVAVRAMLVLAVAFVIMRGVQAWFGVAAMLPLSEVLWMSAALLAMTATARHALRARVIDGECIFAALDAYLLAGVIFGVGFWVLEQNWPSSFGGREVGDLKLSRAIYFSFVTIATLGYGDIVPASDPARGLAVVEAVAGQMYLTVLVARLVSLYSRQANE